MESTKELLVKMDAICYPGTDYFDRYKVLSDEQKKEIHRAESQIIVNGFDKTKVKAHVDENGDIKFD
jgi:hypothetical protein